MNLRKSIVCLLLVVNIVIGNCALAINERNDSVACIQQMLDITMNDERLRKLNDSQKKQVIVDHYLPYFDLQWTAKMSIGINYKKMSDSNQQKYLKEFSKFFSYIWLPYLYVDNTSGARLVIKNKTTRINDQDEYVDVQAYAPDGKTFDIRIRVRNKAEWKHCMVLNVIVDGVDLAMSYRAQFNAYIEKNNGKSDSILDYLVEKNEQYKRTSGIILPIE